ncbi:MAG: MCP four helix bundle domain-containing protein [Deltaproteobacteria bacterium]
MFKNLKLSNKLMISFGAIALVVVAVAALGYSSAKSMHQGMESLYYDQLLPLEQIAIVRVNINRMWADVHRYLLVPDDPRLDQEIAHAVDEIKKQMDLYRATYLTSEEKNLLTRFDLGWADYQKAITETVSLIKNGGEKVALQGLHEGHSTRNARNAVREPLEELTNLQVRIAKELHKASEDNYAKVKNTNIVSGIIGMLLAIILGLTVARSITKPLGKVLDMIDNMSEGHLDSSLVDDGRRDEIGQMTHAAVAISVTVKDVSEDLRQLIDAVEAGTLSFRLDPSRHKGEFASLLKGINQLTDTISRPLTEVAEVMQKVAGGDTQGRMVGAYEGDLRAMKANVNRSLDSLGSLLGELSGISEKLAMGDLRSNVTGNYQGEFALMRTNMNAAINELRKTLGEIASNSQNIAVAATQTSAAAGDVASQSERQLMMLIEVSTAISQTAMSVEEISVNAEKGNALACTTASQSQEGRAQLLKLIQAVELIATSNVKVAKISDRISRIAEKTHILALNAGIEAARAGEHGLGFGIVAQQIGKLAEEASAAVADISTLTAEASHNVGGGVAAAAETQSAIERIAQAAQESEQTVHIIASAITQQAAAVQQLSASVVELQAAGENNAAAATEIDATMESLSKMIQQAADQIGRFTLA